MNPYLAQGLGQAAKGMVDFGVQQDQQKRQDRVADLRERNELEKMIRAKADKLIFESGGELSPDDLARTLKEQFQMDGEDVSPFLSPVVDGLTNELNTGDTLKQRYNNLQYSMLSNTLGSMQNLPQNMQLDYINGMSKQYGEKFGKQLSEQWGQKSYRDFMSRPENQAIIKTSIANNDLDQAFNQLSQEYEAQTGNKGGFTRDSFNAHTSGQIGLLRMEQNKEVDAQAAQLRATLGKTFDANIKQQAARAKSIIDTTLGKKSLAGNYLNNLFREAQFSQAEVDNMISYVQENEDDLELLKYEDFQQQVMSGAGADPEDKVKWISSSVDDYIKTNRAYDVVTQFGSPSSPDYEPQGVKLGNELNNELLKIKNPPVDEDNPRIPRSSQDKDRDRIHLIDQYLQEALAELDHLNSIKGSPMYNANSTEGMKIIEKEIQSMQHLIDNLKQNKEELSSNVIASAKQRQEARKHKGIAALPPVQSIAPRMSNRSRAPQRQPIPPVDMYAGK